MSLPAIVATFLTEMPDRIERASRTLDHLSEVEISPNVDAWFGQLIEVAHDLRFVEDLGAIIPLFSQDATLPDVDAPQEQFDAMCARAFAWQQKNPEMVSSQIQEWISQFAVLPPHAQLPDPFQRFLQETSFSHSGFDVSLAEIWHLARTAPDGITTELEQDFVANTGLISAAFAQYLNMVFVDNAPLLACTLATPLDLLPADVAKLLQLDLPNPKPPTSHPVVFKKPQDMIDAAFTHLCQSNVSGADCRDILAAGHVIVSTSGPDFPFTIQPDPTRPPLVYVPFTGQAKDVILLCHQIGHGLHLWRAARKTHLPVSLLPALDEIIPAYFESYAGEIISGVSRLASDNACHARLNMWQNSVRRYQETALLVIKAGQGDLAADDLADLRQTSLFALIFQGGVFPKLPLSSFAWGHIKAAEFHSADDGETVLFEKFT